MSRRTYRLLNIINSNTPYTIQNNIPKNETNENKDKSVTMQNIITIPTIMEPQNIQTHAYITQPQTITQASDPYPDPSEYDSITLNALDFYPGYINNDDSSTKMILFNIQNQLNIR